MQVRSAVNNEPSTKPLVQGVKENCRVPVRNNRRKDIKEDSRKRKQE